jgi:hypothetical protein
MKEHRNQRIFRAALPGDFDSAGVVRGEKGQAGACNGEALENLSDGHPMPLWRLERNRPFFIIGRFGGRDVAHRARPRTGRRNDEGSDRQATFEVNVAAGIGNS